jgi:hypothetical protein
MEAEEVFVMSSEPWYADKYFRVEDPMAIDWGYLNFFSNGEFDFDANRRPSDREIMASNAYLALTSKIFDVKV